VSVAARYHELTKYDEESVRRGPGLDWSRQPTPFKDIVSQQRVELRRHPPVLVESGSPVPAPPSGDGRLDLAALSRLLFFANGVTGVLRYDGGGQFLRAAPSAGALYPTELYVAARDVPGLDAGLYNYQVRTHELVRLWDGDGFDALGRACGKDLAPAQAVVVATGIYWRSAWRYQERGYRRVLLDTGHVLANLAAYAPHERLSARTHLAFVDADVNGLFFFDDAEEVALACVVLGPGGGADDDDEPPHWPSPSDNGADLAAVTLREEADVKRSAMVRLHRATRCVTNVPDPSPGETLARPRRRAGAPDDSIALPRSTRIDAAVPQAILERRSARAYGQGAIPARTFGRALAFACRGAATLRTGLLRAHVVVLDVDGIDPGVYAIDPTGSRMRRDTSGDLRERLQHVSHGQEIAHRCAATVVLSAPAAAAVERWGERAYRYLHVDAGTLGQRLQLAAGALGLQACGIGGFFDDQAASMIGAPPEDWILYLVTIGVATVGLSG
jgi:SagB-type dehydrogenase family enzyme